MTELLHLRGSGRFLAQFLLLWQAWGQDARGRWEIRQTHLGHQVWLQHKEQSQETRPQMKAQTCEGNQDNDHDCACSWEYGVCVKQPGVVVGRTQRLKVTQGYADSQSQWSTSLRKTIQTCLHLPPILPESILGSLKVLLAPCLLKAHCQKWWLRNPVCLLQCEESCLWWKIKSGSCSSIASPFPSSLSQSVFP